MSQVANTHSIRFKLITVFALFSGIIITMVGSFTWVETKLDHLNELSSFLTQASLKLNEANNAEKNLVLFETINPRFYKTGESRFASMHRTHIDEAEEYLRHISNFEESKTMGIKGKLAQSIDDLDSMKHTFTMLVDLYRDRGFQSTGLIGRMREQIKFVEDGVEMGVPEHLVLKVRKAEKSYIINKQVQYMSQVRQAVDELKAAVGQLPNREVREEAMGHLNSYWLNFLKLARIEEQIGFKEGRGLKHTLSVMSEATDRDLIEIEEIVHQRTLQIRQALFWGVLFMGGLFLGITIIAGIFVLRRLGKPIKTLSHSIREAIDSQFRRNMELHSLESRDEIGQISRDVDYLYGKIQSYATELMQQKEEIMMQAENLSRVNTDLEEKSEQISAKNFELEHQNEMIAKQRDQIEESLYNVQMLSKIGQEITNHLEIEEVVGAVFHSAQDLMPVSTFAVGIYEEENSDLHFYGMEVGKKGMQQGADHVGKKPSGLSDWCFLKGEEVLVQNLNASYVEYVPEKPKLLDELGSQSVIYLPLLVKNKRTGVITVHSTEKNAYSAFQAGMLRNLASYTAIALDNAQVYAQLSAQQKLLSKQAAQLQSANEEISEKNKAIMSSINYAKRMQDTILPKISHIQKALPESFILFEPRDVVSGDFYFFTSVTTEGKTYQVIAAVDCTGHGVPGAFTAVLGSSLLDSIVNEKKQVDAGKILTSLHRAITRTFKQKESDNRDGMDMALCVIDEEEQTLSFSGAKNPLVYIQEGETHIIRGDRHSIGGGELNPQFRFQTHIIDIQKPTTFYLYSDGYQDQFGGKRRRKLMVRRFRKVLTCKADRPMQEQHDYLKQYLHDWIEEGDERQIDDILVMAARVGGK